MFITSYTMQNPDRRLLFAASSRKAEATHNLSGQGKPPSANVSLIGGGEQPQESGIIQALQEQLRQKDKYIRTLKAKLTAMARQDNINGLLRKVIPATVTIYGRKAYHVAPEGLEKIRRHFGVENLADIRDPNFDYAKLEKGFTYPVWGSGYWVNCADGKPRIVTAAHVAERDFFEPTPIGPLKLIPASIQFEVTPNMVHTQESVLSGVKPKPIRVEVAARLSSGKPALTKGKNLGFDVAVMEAEPDFYKNVWPQLKIKPLRFATTADPKLPGSQAMKVGSGASLEGGIDVGRIKGFEARPLHEKALDEEVDLKSIINMETSVSMNPGDSGGPLVDMHGRVLGMNREILTKKDIPLAGSSLVTASDTITAVLKSWGFL